MREIPVYHIDDFEVFNKSFYASDIGSHIRKHGFIEHAHRHHFYLTVLFTEGTGIHEIDFHSYPVTKGSLFLMNPGQIHQWKLSKDIKGYIFFHSGEFYNQQYASRQIDNFPFFSVFQHSPVIYLNEEQLFEQEALFKRILHKSAHIDTPLTLQVIITLIDLLYLDLSGIYQPSGSLPAFGPYLTQLYAFKKLLDTNFISLKSPADYAGLMNITPRHLNRICKETIGKTTGQLITERIILEAQRMLVHSGKATKEIADDLGFDDPSYFIRLFKKETGQTPVAFLKNNRKINL